MLSKKFEMKEDGSYKIPLKSHRVWVTSPINPREIKNVLTNQFLQDSIFNTNRVLDEAAAKVNPGEKWEHYIWVNDKSLIPQSVAFMEANGLIVRDLTELPSFDQTLTRALNDYVDSDRVGAAADFAR